MREFSKAELKFYDVACAAARTSNHSKYKVGAVLVKRKQIISVGVNSQSRSHPLQKRYNALRKSLTAPIHDNIHAEMDAIIKTNVFDLTDASIFVYRGTQSGKANSRPCEACSQALRDKGIKHIYYTTVDGYVYEKFD